ncbi:MAG: LacI family DNA-binding transcriptional regulator [Pseudomonadota bacterium]
MRQTADDWDTSLPTLEDVAREAGVSTATVSRCLNSPDRVLEETRNRVMSVVHDLGYAPNFGARALAAKRTNTIGAIIPTMENAIFARGLQAFQEELGLHGLTLLVASSSYRPDVEEEQIRTLIARGADALLLIGHDRTQGIYDFLDRRGVPYVIAWVYNRSIPRISIGFDNHAAMKALTDQVLNNGHTRIGIITADTASNDRARERLEGFLAAVEEHGIDPASLPIHETAYGIDNGATGFKALMSADPRPTAVMCGNDVLAVGALRMASEMGLAVPGDVSITGFDDIELAQVASPALTTVHVPHRAMGRGAAQMLVDMLEGSRPLESTRLEAELCLRDTLGPCPIDSD